MSQLAFIFPGQGSQSVGMLSQWLEGRAEVQATFAEASEVLGYDLKALVLDGPKEDLNQTDRTQPAMLVAGVASWRVWLAAGGAQPSMMAGHSLGEYSALVCAGAIEFGDAISLVADRGRFMQEAVQAGEGAMAAILGLDDDVVRQVCDRSANGEIVSAANYNSPGQVVIAGQASAVDRAIDAAKQAGAKRAIKLAVSVPSHCALMQPAADRLAARLAGIEVLAPKIPVLHNADVASHNQPDAIREALVKQLDHSVRWVETIEALKAAGVDQLIEAGPGKVLMGLNRRIDRKMHAAPLFDDAGLEALMA